MDNIFRAKVLAVNWKHKGDESSKHIYFRHSSRSNARIGFQLPRSACVTKGDFVYSYVPFDDHLSMERDYLFVKCKNGVAQLTPIYSCKTVLQIGGLNLPVIIKEISQQDEFDGYVALTKYHYRNKTLFGRHAPLVATTLHPMLPRVIGYIDLTTAFFVNMPRRNILDEPTHLNGITWKSWSKETIRKHIPLLVRIARCVIHPELRSIGLGKVLIEHAAEFAKTHWQSAHWKPCFLEISADMLRYIPFAERAGMTFVGETEGNLKRIASSCPRNHFSA